MCDSNLLASFEKRTFCDISKKKYMYSSVFLFIFITCHEKNVHLLRTDQKQTLPERADILDYSTFGRSSLF